MSDDLIPNQIITLITLIIGLVGVYFTSFPIIGGILSMIVVILSAIFGTNTLRKIGGYSLGTGIPSIIYMLVAIGLLSFISALALSLRLNIPELFPISSIVIASLIAVIVALICRYIFKIQVEILYKSFISISIASVFLIIGAASLISQSYNPLMIYENVIKSGIIILLMIMSVMVIQNPFNSCMGPNEDQYRTLSLAIANSSLMLIISSIICILTTKYWILYMLLALCAWFISFRKYIIYTKHQAASVKRYGLWPKSDGE